MHFQVIKSFKKHLVKFLTVCAHGTSQIWWNNLDVFFSESRRPEIISSDLRISLSHFFHIRLSYYSRIPRCENGHLICYLCKCKLTSSLCPICRAEFVLNRPLVAEAVAKLIPFPCKNAKLGCPQQLPWKTRQKHEEKCSYQRYHLKQVLLADTNVELLKFYQ